MVLTSFLSNSVAITADSFLVDLVSFFDALPVMITDSFLTLQTSLLSTLTAGTAGSFLVVLTSFLCALLVSIGNVLIPLVSFLSALPAVTTNNF